MIPFYSNSTINPAKVALLLEEVGPPCEAFPVDPSEGEQHLPGFRAVNRKRLFETVDARPAVAGARAVGQDHAFNKVSDEETRRALFPSNYPPAA